MPNALTKPQMTVLSMLYNTPGQLLLRGSDLRPAELLVARGYAECREGRWHGITAKGADAFLHLLARENTPQGAAARRLLASASGRKGRSVVSEAERLYRAHNADLMRTLGRRFPRVAEPIVEDAVARTWLIVCKRRRSLDQREFGWLLTVATHELYRALNELPPGTLHVRIADSNGVEFERDAVDWLVDPAPEPDQAAIQHEEWAVIHRLHPHQRTALIGRAIGFSYDALADATGHTYTWVNRHTTEGRRALREALAA